MRVKFQFVDPDRIYQSECVKDINLLVSKVQMFVVECGGRGAACLASGSNAGLSDAQNTY